VPAIERGTTRPAKSSSACPGKPRTLPGFEAATHPPPPSSPRYLQYKYAIRAGHVRSRSINRPYSLGMSRNTLPVSEPSRSVLARVFS
jgi:hypothetical protein